MNRQPIVSFAIAWNPNGSRGFVTLRLAGGQETRVPVASAAEFAAIAAVLRESPVFLYEGGLIGTGWEEVAD
jgi:hypothetical protein